MPWCQRSVIYFKNRVQIRKEKTKTAVYIVALTYEIKRHSYLKIKQPALSHAINPNEEIINNSTLRFSCYMTIYNIQSILCLLNISWFFDFLLKTPSGKVETIEND